MRTKSPSARRTIVRATVHNHGNPWHTNGLDMLETKRILLFVFSIHRIFHSLAYTTLLQRNAQ